MLRYVSNAVSIVVIAVLAISCDAGSFVGPGPDLVGDDDTTRVATRLSIDSVPPLITEDDSIAFHVDVLDQDGDAIADAELQWSSTNERVAYVEPTGDSDGMLVAQSPGTTTITASYEDLSASTVIEVHNRPVDLVYVSGSGQQGEPGAPLPNDLVVHVIDKRGDAVSGVQVTFAVISGGGAVSPGSGSTDGQGRAATSWTLGSSGQQTVEARVSAGQARVKNVKDSVVVFTAQIADTTSATEVGSVTITPGRDTLAVGGTTTLEATVADADGNPLDGPTIHWSSSDPAVASVDAEGVVSAVAEGEIDVSATFDGVSGTATITVVGAAEGTLTIAPPDTLYGIGARQTLRVEARAADGSPITDPDVQWSSNDPDIATVDSMGTVTARALGVAVIAASAACCSGDFVEVAVVEDSGQTASVASVVVDPASDTVRVDSTSRLTATVQDSDGNQLTDREVTWTSPNSGVATVDADGLVSAHAEGQVEITATADGVEGTASITVVGAPEGSLTITPVDTLYGIGATVTLTVEARDAYGNVITDPDVQWTSNDPDIATVDSMGIVTARALGVAVITASSACCSGDLEDVVVVEADAPATVSDLAVDSVSTSSVTLQWTQVDDGTGNPADYAIRYGSPGISWSDAYATEVAVAGTAVGETARYTYEGLAEGTGYEFQLISYRGTLNQDATFGETSNIASASTDTGGGGGGGTSPLVDECQTPDAAWIWCDDFEENRLASYFEYDDRDGSLTRDSGVGVDGSSGMRGRYSEGQVNAGALRVAFGRTPDSYFEPVDGGTSDYREIYWRVYLRHEADWVGGGGYKMSRATVFAESNWAQAMIAHLWAGGQSDNNAYLLMDPASGTDEAGNLQTTTYNDFDNLRWMGYTVGQTPIFDSSHVGEWYCVEAHVRLNDAGRSNGVFEFWIDGQPEASRSNLNWLGAYDDYGLNAVFLENYWNSGSPQAQERYFDNFVVSTERIGCE